MNELDHWHPICLSGALGPRPKRVFLAGTPYVVFRTATAIGALPDACPHRGMRLSEGQVRGDRLECPYHGWSFDRDGVGRAPSTPALRLRAACLDAVERFGAVWIRRAGATTVFPDVGPRGYHPVKVHRGRANASLEAVLDNFTEVEHTGMVHLVLGYEAADAARVRTAVTAEAGTVTVRNQGPQRPLPYLLRRVVGLGARDDFVDEWVTRFSPVHAVFRHSWVDPETGRERPGHLSAAVVFTPVHADLTDIYTFAYMSASPTGRFGLDALLGRVAGTLAATEVALDAAILRHVSAPPPGGGPRSRFDKTLRLNRQRIQRIYRGRP